MSCILHNKPGIVSSPGFPRGSIGKEPACSVGDQGSIPRLGRSPGGGHGPPLQYPCLEDPRDRGAWRAAALGVTKSRMRLRDPPAPRPPTQRVSRAPSWVLRASWRLVGLRGAMRTLGLVARWLEAEVAPGTQDLCLQRDHPPGLSPAWGPDARPGGWCQNKLSGRTPSWR